VLILMTYLLVEIGAVLYMGSLAVNSLLGIPLTWSIIVLAAVTGFYTILGGLRAVVWTEMLQLSVLLMGGIALSIATIHAIGGVPQAIEASRAAGQWHLLLPASDPDFPWTMYLGGTLCISTFYCAANQFIVQRALAAKDEWNARMGIVFTDYLKFLMPLIIIVPGLVARQMIPNLSRADLVFPTLVERLLPTGLVGLVMAGLIAAVMGHTSGAINSVTTIATMDFFVPWMKWRAEREQVLESQARSTGFQPVPSITESVAAIPVILYFGEPPGEAAKSEDARAVFFGRIFGIVAIIVGVICAELLTQHSKKPIFLYLLNAYGYFTPGIATMFLLGILWKRTTTEGALTAGALTIPLSIAIQRLWPGLAFQNRTGIVFWSCMIACALVSLCTRTAPDEQLKGLIWTRDSLSLPIEERAKYRGLRRPFFWWAIITAATLFMYIRFA
jgi:SSS family solute:Na+ symporter